jgi:hypothetical protein
MLKFKKFLENYEKALEDEFGINWDDFLKIYDNQGKGQLSKDFNTFLNFGKETYKGGTFEIIPGSLNKNGASVIVTSKTRSYLPGGKVDNGGIVKKIYHLNKKQLFNLLTRGWIAY